MDDRDFDMFGDTAPTNRKQCKDNKQPCPWARCKYHLVFEVFTFPQKATNEEIVDKLLTLKESCVLDVANRGEQTLHQIGKILGTSRERIRQIEGLSDKAYILKGISALRASPKRMRQLTEMKNYENRKVNAENQGQNQNEI